MSKKIGVSFNRFMAMGRVVGDPMIGNGWARVNFKTVVPENVNGDWTDREHMVPLMTNNERTIKTISDYVKDERQLYVEGYVTSWQDQQGNTSCGVMISTVKLGARTMYDDTQNQNQNQNQGGGQQMPAFPPGNN